MLTEMSISPPANGRHRSLLLAGLLGWLLATGVLGLLSAGAAGTGGSLTAVYVLAFDNDPASAVDLGLQYTATVAALTAATAGPAAKTAVILADLGGPADTHILIAGGGVLTPVAGLPDAGGVIDLGLTEYNSASGVDLGGFFIWALANYPADATYLSLVGHGAPLAPETDIGAVFPPAGRVAGPGSPAGGAPFAPPLPIHVDANPDLTDFNSHDLLSPYDLALALDSAIGVDNPLAVLDLVHCFSGSIEELYELSNPAERPFALYMTSSPNYYFFSPAMLGDALAAADASQTPPVLADSLISSYDQNLLTNFDLVDGPAIEHPRLLVAVQSDRIPPIKEAWDRTAFHLLESFALNADRIEMTYHDPAVNKYDMTYCRPQDWALAVPDGLVDIGRFADELAGAFPGGSPVAVWAGETLLRAETAVIARYGQDGFPWFGGAAAPFWDFQGATGISLYADWAGQLLPGDPEPLLSWHAYWYTDTIRPNNPHPYAFVQGGFDGVQWQIAGPGVNWADVFQAHWQAQPVSFPVRTLACLPHFPPLRTSRNHLPGVFRD